MKLQTGVLLLLGLLQTTLAVDLLTDKVCRHLPLHHHLKLINLLFQNNCGRLNHVCHENEGIASCEAGICKLTCNDGWVLKNGICAESKAHKKQRLRLPLSLCPKGETCVLLVALSPSLFALAEYAILSLQGMPDSRL
jgi:hypothetical protein